MTIAKKTTVELGEPCPAFNVEFVGDNTDYKTVQEVVAAHPAVIVDFYTNWCKKCPETARELNAVAKAGKIWVVLVNLEGDEDAVFEFIKDHQLTNIQLHCCLESDDEVSIFGIKGIPHKAAFSCGKLVRNGTDGSIADICKELMQTAGDALGDVTELTTIVDKLVVADTPRTFAPKQPDDSPCSSEPELPPQPAADVGNSASAVSAQWKSWEKNELILRENPQRWVMFPLKYPQIWEMYKKHEASFWTAEEIDLSQDMVDFDKLNSGEVHFLMHVLAFFAGSDGIVLENLAGNFCEEVTIPEARAFFGFQIAMENIHSETYSLLIDQYCRNDEAAKDKLFRAIQEIPVVAKKAQWAAKWMNAESLSFAERLVAFATVEGILFSGSFCAVYWLKKRGLMPGLTFSNELIARDEGLHCDFGCLLYSMLERPLPHHIVHDIIKGAVEVEREFICDALSCDLIGMNKKMMGEYIEFVADRLCTALNVPKLYGAKNPFDWMELISLQGKTNFFEKRVGDYQKAGLMSKIGDAQESAEAAVTFSMDEDF